MGRRKILVIVAVIIATLGTGVVALYVKGADTRADQKFAATQVLVASAAIAPGETVAAIKAAGKITSKSVTTGSLVPGALTDVSSLPDDQVALAAIAPGEQLLPGKFGASSSGSSALGIPDGDVAISIQLDDPARVAGFVNPGDHVVIFASSGGAGGAAGSTSDAKDGTRVLLPNVTVMAVGSTTTVSTTKTDATGAQTTEQLPRTIITLALTQADAQKVLYAGTGGQTLAFGLRGAKSTIDKSLAPANMSNLFN